MATTIKRNSKEYADAFEKARNVIVFNVSNDFHGKAVPSIEESAKRDGKLVKTNISYALRVHSNLWYEWSAA